MHTLEDVTLSQILYFKQAEKLCIHFHSGAFSYLCWIKEVRM